MTASTPSILRNWEPWLFIAVLILLAIVSGGSRYLPMPQALRFTNDAQMPAIPQIVPWREQPLPFIQPDIASDIDSPFAVTFHFPKVEPQAVADVQPAPRDAGDPPPPPPPPKPARIVKIVYNGVYTGVTGVTVALLELSDNFGWRGKENPRIGETFLGQLEIQEVNPDRVVIKATDGRRWSILRRDAMELAMPQP